MLKYLVHFLLLGTIVSASPCSKYVCKDLQSNTPDPICAFSVQENYGEPPTVALKECASKMRGCEGLNSKLGNNTKLFCIEGSIKWKPALAGNVCMKDSDCLSGMCIWNSTAWTSMCSGLRDNEPCYSHAQCDIGFFCKRKDTGKAVCSPTAKLSEKCSSTKPCGYGLICYDKVCIPVMSLPIGSNVSSDDPLAYRACSTLSVEAGQCVAPAKLVGNSSQNERGKICNYTRGDTREPVLNLITAESSCGYSIEGLAFCPYGVGDYPGELRALYQEYFSKVPACHFKELLVRGCNYPFFAKDLKMTPTLSRALFLVGDALQLGNSYSMASVLIQDNGYCTQNMMTKDYWNANCNPYMIAKPSDSAQTSDGNEGKDMIETNKLVRNLLF